MSRPGIIGLGAYAPRSYVTSDSFAEAWEGHAAAGIQRCAVPDGDEDALTMAWEASSRALDAAGQEPGDVVYLSFATTTPPVAEEDLAVRLASTLGVPTDTRLSTTVASARSGTDALVSAVEAGPWADGIGVVVAADVPRGTPDDAAGQAAGAGAGAIVLGAEGPGRIEAIGHGSAVSPGDRFRRPDEAVSDALGVTSYDRAAYQEAVVGAVEALSQWPTDVDAATIAAPNGKRPYRLADALDLEPATITAGTTVHDLGYTAAADVLLGLATARSAGAASVLAVGYGSGAGADALYLEIDGVPVELSIDPIDQVGYSTYLRRRGELDGRELTGGGAYISLPTWRRGLPQRHRLEAGRCLDCDSLVFLPDGACRHCGSTLGYESVALDGTGTIETVTTITAGAPPEFDAYQTRQGSFQTAIVALDSPAGEAVSAPLMVVGPTVEPGDTVESIVRRIYTQEGLPRYGRKVTARD